MVLLGRKFNTRKRLIIEKKTTNLGENLKSSRSVHSFLIYLLHQDFHLTVWICRIKLDKKSDKKCMSILTIWRWKIFYWWSHKRLNDSQCNLAKQSTSGQILKQKNMSIIIWILKTQWQEFTDSLFFINSSLFVCLIVINSKDTLIKIRWMNVINKALSLVFLLLSQDLEKLQEKTDDVHIDHHSTHSIVIQCESISLSSHNQLNINQKVNHVDYRQAHWNSQIQKWTFDKENID